MPLNEKNRYVHKKYTKLSVEQTIVPGRLHSELCAWGVNGEDLKYGHEYFTKDNSVRGQKFTVNCHISLVERYF